MAIGPGARLGPYEVTALIGEGGMGKVWRAHHAALKRDDALKVLPDAFVADPERLARFHREAQVLASLNHPNIAHVYGFEDAQEAKALVMELVEGPTLADRIAEGAIPLHDALSIAIQMAEALEAAHEQGIVHRDLKPANIKVRPDGTVKVLDFGLAKAMESPTTGPAKAGHYGDLTLSPTITTPAMTQVGVILGTAAYMSPEQAKGRPADKRSDIWSFGCVLYEMLTGRRAFDGDDVGDTLASVIKGDPDWSLLPSDLPPAVRTLLERCLAKDRRKRIADISVAHFVLTEQATLRAQAGTGTTTIVRPPPLWKRLVPVASAVVLTAAIAGVVASRVTPAVPRPVVQFSIPVPDQAALTSGQPVSISPDGSQIVYAASLQLYVRSLADTEPRRIAGTRIDGATARFPVFSPDGTSIAFWSQGDQTLRKIPVTGGVSVPLGETPYPLGLSWDEDWILFGHLGGISRVSANGGKPEVIVTLEPGEFGGTPRMMPGGRAVLFSVARGLTGEQWDTAEITVQDLASGERKVLVRGGSDARYVKTGHLVFAVGGVLQAVPFDLDRLEVTGAPVPVVLGVQRLSTRVAAGQAATATAYYSLSDTGSLIYVPGPTSPLARTGIALIDRDGTPKVLPLSAGTYGNPRVSPDGARIAFGTDDGKEGDVWEYELSGQAQARRLTFGGGNRFPVWSSDGTRVAFQSSREGDRAIWWQPVENGTAERLTTPEDKETSHVPDSFARDGRTLSFTVRKGTTSGIWMLSLPDKKAAAFPVSAHRVSNSAFSPDGRWLAYQSTDARTAGVLVESFPPRGIPNQIAMRDIATPHHPFWSRDGKELFYLPGPNEFAVVRVTTPAFSVSNAESLPRGVFLEGGPDAARNMDVLPDGRFVGVVDLAQSESGDPSAPRINVVLNWSEELKRMVPTQ